MRLALVGPNSFIATHVSRSAAERGIDVIPVSRDANLDDALRGVDAAIGFSLDPAFRTQPYREAADCELAIARAAAYRGARFVMLSTRRVYPAAHRWGAKETAPADGDETAYGRNKAMTETAVREATGGSALILRLSNVIGFEYDPAGQRGTFMSILMRSLKAKGEIYYDMHPDTRRDFLTVTLCARAIVEAVLSGSSGTFNLGCGFPIACGALAAWIIEGYGGGKLIVTNEEIRDAFYLDMTKWCDAFSQTATPGTMQSEIVAFGRRLRHA